MSRERTPAPRRTELLESVKDYITRLAVYAALGLGVAAMWYGFLRLVLG